jgi:S1-C subfamily serine protease
MSPIKRIISTKERPFAQVVSDLRHVVFSVIRDRPSSTGVGVTSVALGTGFFVKEELFITCEHVINNSEDPHREGDSYRLIANLTGSSPRIHQVTSPSVGSELNFYPELDLAVLQVPVTGEQPSANLSYAEVELGEEIGIAGYPLAELFNDPKGNLQLSGLIYRCGRGVVTGRYEVAVTQTASPLPIIETNFMFVSGNSGGPVFSPATGTVFGMVKMFRYKKLADLVCDADSPQQLPLGINGTYLSAVFAIYSGGIKLDAFRAALEGFGVTP